ncbi:MAG: hypothetical protein SWK76_10030 [Actinomycetota bacterium]|nr:hypothetical protein [Actinomycetota bacterium]
MLKRYRMGKSFSIVAVAEGALPWQEEASPVGKAVETRDKNGAVREELKRLADRMNDNTIRLASELEELMRLESRVTILGHLQRGEPLRHRTGFWRASWAPPPPTWLRERTSGVAAGSQSSCTVPVPLERVAGKRKCVPVDHPLVESARQLETCSGDE